VDIFWGGELYALSSATPTPQAYSSHDRTTEASRLSRYGMTCEPLTGVAGGALLMSFLAGFPARATAERLEDALWRKISGRKCDASWQMSLPGTSLPRTSSEGQSTERPTTSGRWVTRSGAFPYPRRTWVRTIFGSGTGYLHTPTCAANYDAPSMQKHAGCREFVRVFGKPAPMNHEWLMGWPVGWTDLRPLEMGKFPAWRRQHSLSLPEPLSEAA
jgi:hypothetical protein